MVWCCSTASISRTSTWKTWRSYRSLELSNPNELLLRLHWVAILYGQIKADLAITGGVHTAEDVLKSMMAGARVAMMTSALLKNGIEHIGRRCWPTCGPGWRSTSTNPSRRCRAA